MADAAMNVGCRALDVTDAVQSVRLPLHLLYPTASPARTESFGPYPLDAAMNAPIDAPAAPLVVVSHGNGGTPWAYRGLASYLARAGFAVAMLEHIGNSRTDNTLAGTPANLAHRPRHVRLALDAIGADPIARHLAPGAAVIGHSIGGYTALAVAGGRPMALPRETADGIAHPVPVETDPRVRAVVLLAPALPWYMGPGALDGVQVPLLVRSGERDELMPPWVIEQVLRGLPGDARMDYAVAPGAGHFAFITPVPPAMAGPHFPPSQDPPGFDRAAYQAQLYPEIRSFLLTSAGRSS